MKKLLFVMLSGLLGLLVASPLAAQVEASAALAKASAQPNFLPVKKALLLYELPVVDDAALPDDPEDPEAILDERQIADQAYEVNLLLHLFSTAELGVIHVKVGTSPGAADFAQYSFAFDQQSDLPSPFSYQRDGKTIVLGMGQTKGLPTLFAEVQLEDRTGRRSEVRYDRVE